MPLASKHVFKQRDAMTNTEAATPRHFVCHGIVDSTRNYENNYHMSFASHRDDGFSILRGVIDSCGQCRHGDLSGKSTNPQKPAKLSTTLLNIA